MFLKIWGTKANGYPQLVAALPQSRAQPGLRVRPGPARPFPRPAARPPRGPGLPLRQPGLGGGAGPAERCLPAGAAPPARVPAMEVLRRSSVFAAEIMDAFDRSPTDKELVAQAKALGREFVHARLLRAGLAWSAPERAAPAPGGRLAEVCAVLLRLGEWGPGGRGPQAAPPELVGGAGPCVPPGTAVSALASLPGDPINTLPCWASVSLGREEAGLGRHAHAPVPPCPSLSPLRLPARRPPRSCLVGPDFRCSGWKE